MRVLIFHGYLLRGTGSNVYNASLAPALARLGHEVHLLCQDREPTSTSAMRPGASRSTTPTSAACCRSTSHDRYEGFEVKTFPELTDAELERYLDGQRRPRSREVVAAARRRRRRARQPPGHGPGDPRPRRAALRGQDPRLAPSRTRSSRNPRFLPYAREGMAAAPGVLVGSRHTAESLWEAVADPELPTRRPASARPASTRERFAPLPPSRGSAPEPARARRDRARRGRGRPRARRPAAAAAVELRSPAAPGPRVVFVGKLIVSKGVDLLLAAWPLVHAAHPGARLLVVGFGATRTRPQRCWRALDARRPRRGARDRRRGRGLEGGEAGPLPILSAFLGRPAAGYAERGPRGGRQRRVRRPARARRGRPSSCPAPRRWSCRAPSRRRSGWSPPRPRPAARCRSRPATRGCSRSRASSPTALPAERRRAALVPGRRGRGRGDRRPARRAGWRSPEAERERAREALVETRAPALELGGGRPRGARRRRPGGSRLPLP